MKSLYSFLSIIFFNSLWLIWLCTLFCQWTKTMYWIVLVVYFLCALSGPAHIFIGLIAYNNQNNWNSREKCVDGTAHIVETSNKQLFRRIEANIVVLVCANFSIVSIYVWCRLSGTANSEVTREAKKAHNGNALEQFKLIASSGEKEQIVFCLIFSREKTNCVTFLNCTQESR